MSRMRAMVVHKAGGPLAAEERDIPVPGPEEMRIRVQACGVCHSDVADGRRPACRSSIRAFPATR